MIVLSDEVVFSGVYAKYFPRMVVFAVSFVGTAEAAEDIVQDVFLKLHQLKYEFEREAALKSFLYTTVRNKAIDRLRAEQRSQKINQKIGEDYLDETLLNDELDGDLVYLLAQALRDLPPQSKKVIELLYENDLSYREVADRLGISPNTVKNLRKFALNLLRKKFDGRKLLSLFLTGMRLSAGV